MKKKSAVYHKFYFVLCAAALCIAMSQAVYASNYVETAVKALANEVGWAGVAGTLMGIAFGGFKRSLSIAIGSLLLGGFVTVLLFNPDLIKTIGETVFSFLN